MTIASIHYVTTVADITPGLLSKILSHKVTSYNLKPLGKGVLSNVQLLTVCYDEITSTNGSPTQFIVKLKKPEIPLPGLFSVEGAFYKLIESISIRESSFPFHLAEAYAAGSSWLMLEFISEVRTFNVYEGCPCHLFDDLVERLAKMHAFFWIHEHEAQFRVLKTYSDKLARNPGVGHSLPTSSRQEMFLPAWPAVRERLPANDLLLQRVDTIVEWTASDCRIEKCASHMSGTKYTLVHGDFHIGNVLLPKEEVVDCESKHSMRSWLVDWSMAGAGNPLIDLVFFLVVGSPSIPVLESDTIAANIKSVLQAYQYALNKDRVLLSWEELVFNFRVCLLNQFVLLVCYDSLCRNMADASDENERQVYHSHFDRVNARCAMMLLSEFGWADDILDSDKRCNA